MRDVKLLALIEGALFIAIAEVLSRISPGGETYFSISLGMIPIIFFALRRGWKYGLPVGLVYGLLKIVLGNVWAVHWAQVLIEYTLPYLSLGFAGLVSVRLLQAARKEKKKTAISYIVVGSIIGGFARYFWHFIAGVIFFGEYAPEGMSPYFYSFLFNGAHFLQGTAVTIILLVALYAKAPRLFLPRR
jgi:thiamine transporter